MTKEAPVKLVRDLMQIGVKTCRTDTSVAEAIRILLEENLESLIVLDERGHAVGRLSRSEVVAAYGRSQMTPEDCRDLTAESIMQPEILELPPDIPATAAIQIMLDRQVREIHLMHHDSGISWPAATLRFEDVLQYLVDEKTA